MQAPSFIPTSSRSRDFESTRPDDLAVRVLVGRRAEAHRDARASGARRSPLAQFSGVMTNPMLMPDAGRRLPAAEIGESGWDLYLMARVRSADYLSPSG